MFQVYIESIEPIVANLLGSAWPLYAGPREIWRSVGDHEAGQREVFVQDPDGYLVVIAHDLGSRQISHDLPTFQTSRLTLRPRTMADLHACLAMDRDPEVTRFIAGPWADPEAHRAFVEQRIRHAFPPGMGYWSVIGPQGFVGWILLAPLDLRGPEIEIGWRLIRAAWGRGYATEAARVVLDHALTALGLAEVVADVDPANAASTGVARKLGMAPARLVPYRGRTVIRYVASPAGRAQ
jgi:RimJ/RimL family protein N-acetyltransferase